MIRPTESDIKFVMNRSITETKDTKLMNAWNKYKNVCDNFGQKSMLYFSLIKIYNKKRGK